MARRHPHRFCKGCGKPREDEPGGLLSAVGLCYGCGKERREENITQLSAREGPYYDHFVRMRFLKALRAAEALNARVPLEKAS